MFLRAGLAQVCLSRGPVSLVGFFIPACLALVGFGHGWHTPHPASFCHRCELRHPAIDDGPSPKIILFLKKMVEIGNLKKQLISDTTPTGGAREGVCVCVCVV